MDNKEYSSEEEFLRDYNPELFPRLALTTDILVFSISNEEGNNYRKLGNKYFSVLLVKRDNYPFKDKWCLPGGFIRVDEELEDAPRRILKEEANVKNIYLEQLGTFGGIKRDPRMRVLSTSYMALIDKNRLSDTLGKNASWFKIRKDEDDNKVKITLDNGEEIIDFTLGKKLVSLTTDRYRYVVEENESLAFDHSIVIATGMERLKNKIEYTDIVFNMMPEYFTLGELQQVYEVILGKKLLDPAFRRIIADKVEKTELVQGGGGHRPSALFKYRHKK